MMNHRTAKGFSLKPEKHDVNLYDSLPVSTFVKKTLIQKGVYTKKHFAQFYISDFLDIKGVNVYTAYLTQKKLAEYNISMNAGVEWDRFERKMDEAFCYTDGIQSDVLREIFKKALVCYMKSYKF